MAEKNQAVEAAAEEPRKRKWLSPKKRAAGYAEELRKGVHMRGPKDGQQLDPYNRGLRSGYLLAQSDNTGIYKYNKARDAGAEKSDAQEYSRTIGKEAGESFWAKLMKKLKGK